MEKVTKLNNIKKLSSYVASSKMLEHLGDKCSIRGAIYKNNKTYITDGAVGIVVNTDLSEYNLTKASGTEPFDLDKELDKRKIDLLNIDLSNLESLKANEDDMNIEIYFTNDKKAKPNYFDFYLFKKLVDCFSVKNTLVYYGKDCIVLEEKDHSNISKRGIIMKLKIGE